MVLAIIAALAAIGQELDALSTIWGLYYRKPPLVEANIKPFNLGLVKHPVLLAIVKPALALAITVPLAIFIHGDAYEAFASAPGFVLAIVGFAMASRNYELIKQ
jgi:hypothetical protein